MLANAAILPVRHTLKSVKKIALLDDFQPLAARSRIPHDARELRLPEPLIVEVANHAVDNVRRPFTQAAREFRVFMIKLERSRSSWKFDAFISYPDDSPRYR